MLKQNLKIFLILFLVLGFLVKNSSAEVLLSDGFESGLGNWSLSDPAIHWQSGDFAHTGNYSHKVQDIGSLGEIATYNFTSPSNKKIYLSFWWLLDGATDTGGKLGRFVAGGTNAQFEIWWTNESHSIVVHHYDTTEEFPECNVGVSRVHYANVDIFDNNWHHFETFIEYNTPGVNDGVLRVWVDRPESASFGDSAYLKVNDNDVRFINTGVCELYYSVLRLPTNLDARMQPGYLYYDDVELADELPSLDVTPPSAPVGLNII
ncbi:MAG: hypothetical protein V3574_00085 [Candidatus Moraniibacteriota bacterium]